MPFSTSPFPMVQRDRRNRLKTYVKPQVDEATAKALKELSKQTEARLVALNAAEKVRRQTKVDMTRDHKPVRPGAPLARDTGEGMPRFDVPADVVQPSGRTIGHGQGKAYVEQKSKRRGK